MSIYQYVPGGKATEDMRYKLRWMKDTVTFQRKDYLTQDLQQVICYVDNLLTLLQHVESELRQANPPTPVDRDISSRVGSRGVRGTASTDRILQLLLDIDRRLQTLEGQDRELRMQEQEPDTHEGVQALNLHWLDCPSEYCTAYCQLSIYLLPVLIFIISVQEKRSCLYKHQHTYKNVIN